PRNLPPLPPPTHPIPSTFPARQPLHFTATPQDPGILQSTSSSTSTSAGSDSSGGTVTPGASTPWWLAGIGAEDAQPTASHPEAAGEHGWQADALLSVAPFAVMFASHAAGRTLLADPATQRTVTPNSTAPSSPVSSSFAAANASASPAWPKRTRTLAARFKSLRREANGDNSDPVSARADSPPTASPSPSPAAKSTTTPPSKSPSSASRLSPATTSAATTSSRRPSLLRTLRGEVKLFSGRLRKDPGRVEEGRRMSGGESAHIGYLEGSEDENEDIVGLDRL
ncbi:hypothetical protein DFH09DRAFT_1214014, partial [Mycena vulgaris]